MNLPSRKLPLRTRPEQSGYTFALAVLYSFFLHAAIVAATILLHFLVIPKAVLPPAYQVKLVGQPKETAPTAAPVPSAKEAAPEPKKPQPKQKQAAVKSKKAAPKKEALPDLAQQKKKKATPEPLEQTKLHETTPQKPPAIPSVPAQGPATGKKSEGVDVTPQQDFKYSYYIDNVSNLISQNWNPPPGSKDAKARVIFKINRSGWVVAVRLDDQHTKGSFPFQQAAYRAIYASNPFPRLPEEFLQPVLEFTVDLIPEE